MQARSASSGSEAMLILDRLRPPCLLLGPKFGASLNAQTQGSSGCAEQNYRKRSAEQKINFAKLSLAQAPTLAQVIFQLDSSKPPTHRHVPPINWQASNWLVGS